MQDEYDVENGIEIHNVDPNSPFAIWERFMNDRQNGVSNARRNRENREQPWLRHPRKPREYPRKGTPEYERLRLNSEQYASRPYQPMFPKSPITIREFDVDEYEDDDSPDYNEEMIARINNIQRHLNRIKAELIQQKKIISNLSNTMALSETGYENLRRIKCNFNNLVKAVRTFEGFLEEGIQTGDLGDSYEIGYSLRSYYNGVKHLSGSIRYMISNEKRITTSGIGEIFEMDDNADIVYGRKGQERISMDNDTGVDPDPPIGNMNGVEELELVDEVELVPTLSGACDDTGVDLDSPDDVDESLWEEPEYEY